MTTGVRWLSVPPGSGFGDASERYLSGLRAAGIPVSWTPLGWPSHEWDAAYGPVPGAGLDSAHRDIANLPIPYDRVVVCSTPLWHDRLEGEANGRLRVAYTTWETDRLSPESVAVLNRYDRVLVPSRFNASVFESSGVRRPIHVIPHIVRRPPFSSPPKRGEGKFVFYLIATWTARKAVLDAVWAYLTAFTAADHVVLSIHTTPEDLIACARLARGESGEAQSRASWFSLARALAGRRRAPEITLSTRRLTRQEVELRHAAGDCFFSMSRGEGWGLGAFDAVAFGNPVVVTGWGGTLDFLPEGYPYCVEYDLVDTSREEADLWWEPRAGERWAKARIEHAATLLRRVFQHRDEAREWGYVLQSAVTAEFSQVEVTRQLIDALA